jgi:hypothetical protein
MEAIKQLKSTKLPLEMVPILLELLSKNPYLAPKIEELLIDMNLTDQIIMKIIESSNSERLVDLYMNICTVDELLNLVNLVPQVTNYTIRKIFNEKLKFYKVIETLMSESNEEGIKLAILHLISTSTSVEMNQRFSECVIALMEQSRQSLHDRIQLVGLDCLYHLYTKKHIDLFRYSHFLLSRLIDIWVNFELIDYSCLAYLRLVYPDICDPLLDNSLLVCTSLILLDLPFLEPLVDLALISLNRCIKNGSKIISVLILPSLNAISDVTLVCRNKWNDIIETIERNKISTMDYSYVSKPDLHLPASTYPILYHLANTPEFKKCEMGNVVSVMPALRSILFASNVFENEDSLAYEQLNHFCSTITSYRTCDYLKIHWFLLYLLNRGKFSKFILTRCIPKLTVKNDPFVISACLKTILTISNPVAEATTLERVGLEALLEIYKIQPRVWTQIRRVIANWANRFKGSNAGSKKKTELAIREEELLEEHMTKLILYFSTEDPENVGGDLLPIIIGLLKCSIIQEFGNSRDLSSIGTDNMLQTLLICFSGGVSSPITGNLKFQKAWNVFLKSYFDSQANNSFTVIFARLCDFIALIARSIDGK